MSNNPKVRQHMWTVALNAAHDVGLSKLQGTLEISKNYSVELALNRGLFDLGVLSLEDFEIFDKRYRQKYVDVVAENKEKRENSHIPKRELELQKREQCQTSAQKLNSDSKLSDLDRVFKQQLEEWDTRDVAWKIKAIAYAKKHPDLQYAKLIIAKDCDIISQQPFKEGESAI